MWDNLVSLMSEIVEIYQAIVAISRQKKKALVSADVKELSQLTKQEEALILQIGKLEAARERIVGDLASVYALKTEELNLSKAKELAGGEVSVQLEDLERQLVAITSELAPLNKLNTKLIQQSLNYINYNLNLLTQTPAGTNYAAKGSGETAPRTKALIDAKV